MYSSMLVCSLKRLQQSKKTLHSLHLKGIYPIEFKYNGCSIHWKDIVDSQTYTCSSRIRPEISKLFATHFDTLDLTKQKGFVWANITPSSHILFKNTTFPQHMTCDDEIYIWDYNEIRSISDFYKNFYGNRG